LKPPVNEATDLFRTSTIKFGETEYVLRELSVKENDVCVAASKQADGTFDGRIMMRFMVLKSIVEPKTTDVSLAELPNRLYLRLCDAVSDLNADDVDDLPEGEDEAKND